MKRDALFLLLIVLLGGAGVAAQHFAPYGQGCNIVDNENYNGASSAVFSCFSVPDPTTHRWESDLRVRGFTGNLNQPNNQYFGGYNIGVEGTFVNGQETVNRFFIWDFGTNQTILYHQDFTPDLLATDVSFWAAHNVYAGQQVHAMSGYVVGPEWSVGVDATTCHRFKGGLCVAP